MSERIRIKPPAKGDYLATVSFKVTPGQAKEFADDLRFISNERYGVAGNPHQIHSVPDYALILSALAHDRREAERWSKQNLEFGEMEGLS